MPSCPPQCEFPEEILAESGGQKGKDVMSFHPIQPLRAVCAIFAIGGASVIGALPVHAQYLVTTGTTTALFSGTGPDVVNPTATNGTTYDDSITLRTLPFSFSFFGSTQSAIRVSTNGNISFTNNTSGNNVGFPNSKMIAPLWDDLYIRQGTNDYITEIAGTNYEAIDWHVDTVNNGAGNTNFQDFQAVIFGGNVTINGFNFQANDIAFSYNTLNSQFFAGNNVSIGLDSGNTSQNFALAPNAPARNGLYVGGEATTGATAVPIYSNSGSFLLFRSNGANGYTSSIAGTATAPEPGAIPLLVGGLSTASLVGFVRHRRN
jgi:hypothetical protein